MTTVVENEHPSSEQITIQSSSISKGSSTSIKTTWMTNTVPPATTNSNGTNNAINNASGTKSKVGAFVSKLRTSISEATTSPSTSPMASPQTNHTSNSSTGATSSSQLNRSKSFGGQHQTNTNTNFTKKGSFWKGNRKVPGTVKHEVTKVMGAHYPPPYQLQGSPTREKDISRSLSDSDVQPLPNDTNANANKASSPIEERSSNSRLQKLQKLLAQDIVDLDLLRKLSWKGVPSEVRSMVWKLLLGYLPTNKDRREATLLRKRKEYCDCIPKYFDVDDSERTPDEKALFRQIQIDVPRTNPTNTLFQSTIVQQTLARILYVWAIRHPASGYVQGINDLATPFFVVFLAEYLRCTEADTEKAVIEKVPKEEQQKIEADTYWCLTKLLDGIQDCYTFAQPGIQRMIHKLSELIHRIDAPLHEHLISQEVHFIQFAFRWMNCLLMRELPLPLLIRVWDTYFAELESFSIYHVYVCAAFLHKFSEELRRLDFQDIMLFLKSPPTYNWGGRDIEMILSQGYMWKTLFEDAPNHLSQ